MDRRLQAAVRLRAEGRCEYCHFQEAFARLPFQVDHIIPEKHQGPTTLPVITIDTCPAPAPLWRAWRRTWWWFNFTILHFSFQPGVDPAKCPTTGSERVRGRVWRVGARNAGEQRLKKAQRVAVGIELAPEDNGALLGAGVFGTLNHRNLIVPAIP